MEATPAVSAKKVVLVVEDEPTVGELIADAITDELGYRAIHVIAPAQALETTRHVTPDVMVVDIRLPGMSGLELFDRIRSDPRTKTVPILFETGHEIDDMSEFRRRGIATYVKKPFDLDAIVGYVKRLASSAPVSAAPSRASAMPQRA